MECELCGRQCDCRPALIDGVKMMVCPSCMKHGKEISQPAPSPVTTDRSIIDRIRKPKVKDVYKDMDKELVSNWHEVIKKGREKKGFSREELGFRIGERTVTIAKIENGDLKPSDKVAEKLEKELEIVLFEEVSSVHIGSADGHERGLTLGDFIKTEKK